MNANKQYNFWITINIIAWVASIYLVLSQSFTKLDDLILNIPKSMILIGFLTFLTRRLVWVSELHRMASLNNVLSEMQLYILKDKRGTCPNDDEKIIQAYTEALKTFHK